MQRGEKISWGEIGGRVGDVGGDFNFLVECVRSIQQKGGNVNREQQEMD